MRPFGSLGSIARHSFAGRVTESFQRSARSKVASAPGCYPISSAGSPEMRPLKAVGPRVTGMPEEVVLIDTVIRLEQLIDGHRVWWADGYWHCDCSDWNSCGCSHTLKAAAAFTITRRLI